MHVVKGDTCLQKTPLKHRFISRRSCRSEITCQAHRVQTLRDLLQQPGCHQVSSIAKKISAAHSVILG